MFNFTETNEVLKHKFLKLHSTVVNNVNPASVIDFLFQEAVIGADDMRALLRIKDDPQHQCRELLALLHTSVNRQAFIQLYQAIKKETYMKWLIEDIDKFTDQSLQQLKHQRLQQQQQRYISEPTGKCAFQTKKIQIRIEY